MALRQVYVPYTGVYDYGIGVDLASGSPMGKVVTGAVSGVENAHGARTEWEITRIHSTSELEEKLGINVEASYGCGMFGSVSARFGFAKKSKIQSSSLFLAITASVDLEFTSIDEPSLTEAATQIVNRDDAFSARYGNMFVRGIRRGGLFVGVMQIDTSSSEASEAISAELEGSYGLFSAEAKVKLDSLKRDYRSEIHIRVYHEGGPIDLSLADINDPAGLYEMLQKWLNSFQVSPDQNAVPYYVALAPIAVANGPIPPNIAQIQHAQDILVICAKQRSMILDKINLMDYIAQNPSSYDFAAPTTMEGIVSASLGYQADLDLIAETASQAINDVTKAVTPADYAQQKQRRYPQGALPNPMPTLKQGLPQPKIVPNFVGMTIANALSHAEQIGISLYEFEPQGENDPPYPPLWQVLQQGYIDEDDVIRYHPHTNDQIVVIWQQQVPGTLLLPGDVLFVAVNLAPGVSA